MTTKLVTRKFNIRPHRPEARGKAAPEARAPVAEGNVARAAMTETAPDDATAELEAISREGLSGRQLRAARRNATRHGLAPQSDFDAVRLLRARGIDPFRVDSALARMLPGNRRSEPTQADEDDGPQLPQTYSAPAAPSEYAPQERESLEVMEIQRDIARRRRRRLALLAARLLVFVMLPTLMAGIYYYRIATPLYATEAEFVIQSVDQEGGMAGFASLFAGTGLATNEDSIAVQSYLGSREAMMRLDAEHGFKAHFSQGHIDPIRRLAEDASNEDAYALYRRQVQIGFDPAEGLVQLKVIAADPEASETFSRALISYAEEQVDQLTQRLREDQMDGARQSFEEAEVAMQSARERMVELQEQFEILSGDSEVELLTGQIAALESQLIEERLALQEILANESPSQGRIAPREARIENLRAEVRDLRSQLTADTEGRESLARIRSQLLMAEQDVEIRQAMMSKSLEQLEQARIEANRQVRYLSMGVSPVAPDRPTHPRAFENTLVAFLIMLGLYLLVSMTASILREQVSS